LSVVINGSRPIVWLEELVWETLVGCLNPYSIMFEVNSVEGM